MPPRLTRHSSRTNGATETQPNQLGLRDPSPTRNAENTQAAPQKKKRKQSKRVNQTSPQENDNENLNNNNLDNTTADNHPPDEDEDNEADRLTVDNYKEHMDAWSVGRLRTAIKKYKSSGGTRASTEVQTKARLINSKYEHELLMLALVDKVQLRTIKKAIDEVAPKKNPSNLGMYVSYAKESLALSMPNRGQEDGGDMLSQRNRINTDRWKALSLDQKAIFSPSLFYTLAGAPNPYAASDNEDADDEDERGDIIVSVPKVRRLTPEEEALYRPIYEEMVDDDRVSANISKPKLGPSDALLQRKSLTAFQKFAHELACLANRLDFAFYLVGSSTLTPDKSNALGWTREFTTHQQVARWANKTSGLARVFATYAQGAAMADAIASATHPPELKPKRKRSDKPQRSDRIKIQLGRMLVQLTVKALGRKPTQSFPLTEDPKSALLKRKVPLEMVRSDACTLSEEALKLGFKKMRTKD
ncbi:uncharacterized protein MELLADRAFT_92404 [Melampsora larici-populina 98AG31]|uniref:Uncharacterized protein n=1 Tax=Melampsora larici-populina (strain 98AG31 / pathotype 3-4-7) TaxID=747676 RepID=F4R9I5_MELLP|nr:uncharacterized protein MELLADRAFT_92404 [Melampsora larici-populina 98AG31]EGG10987.1 hypothetical protein MELLADRAFT_92404 [Melampsora larici-populina 98AG31]